jgi:hypothetical protein
MEIIGRRLGTPFDPQISLIDQESDKELAYSNDAPGLQTDARMTYTFQSPGDYLLQVRDSRGRGGPEYGYRLRLGDFPCATSPLPLAGKKGSPVAVRFTGPNVADVPPVDIHVPSDADIASITPRFANGLAGWPVSLIASDLDEIFEEEPNNQPDRANRIPVPIGITGQFQCSADTDQFVFPAKKGQRWIIRASTQELVSPTEVTMTLKDSQGKQVAATTPQGEPMIDFTPQADGDYTLTVEHLLHLGGPEEAYRLTIMPFEPGIELSLGVDRIDLPPGGYALIPIEKIVRRGYDGPIDVTVAGPPGLSGAATLPASSQNGTLFVRADPQMAPGAHSFFVQGRATINGQPVTARASTLPVLRRSLANLPVPPLHLHNAVAAGIIAPAPFALEFKFDDAEHLRGKPVGLTVTAARAPGFTDEIALTATALPRGVSADLPRIPKDQTETKLELKTDPSSALGKFLVSITGKARHENRNYTVLARPEEMVLSPPFELAVQPASLKLTGGERGKLKVTATRNARYDGPIALEVRNLPKKVTASKTTIGRDEREAELEITAAVDASGEQTNVQVQGTAPDAANQTHVSPSFTIAVRPKFAPPRTLSIIG